jgi:hypothetical protein
MEAYELRHCRRTKVEMLTCSSPMRERSHTMSRRSAPQDDSTVSFFGLHLRCAHTPRSASPTQQAFDVLSAGSTAQAAAAPSLQIASKQIGSWFRSLQSWTLGSAHPIWKTSSAWCSSTCSRFVRFRRSCSATCTRSMTGGFDVDSVRKEECRAWGMVVRVCGKQHSRATSGRHTRTVLSAEPVASTYSLKGLKARQLTSA